MGDIFWLMDAETLSGKLGEEKDLRKSFVELVKKVFREKIVSSSSFEQTLEPELLDEAEIIDCTSFKRNVILYNTREL